MVEPVAQRLPFHKRHDVVEEAVGFSRVDETEDVGVLEMRSDLDLFQEPIGADDGRQLSAQFLEGDLPIVAYVVCEVDRRHAARAEQALDAIAAGEGGTETGGVGQSAQRQYAPVTAARKIAGAARTTPSGFRDSVV